MKTSSQFALILLLPFAFINSPAADVGQADSTTIPAPTGASVVHDHTAAEIVRMQDAGVQKPVLIEYIHNVHVPYKATAEDVLYLHDRKVPDDVILEWIRQGGSLTAAPVQAAPVQNQYQAQTGVARSPDLVAANTPPTPPVIEQQQPQAQPQQQQTVYQTQPTVVTVPSYTYAYPNYVYSDYYYPSVSLGFSWGYPYYYGGHYHGHYYGHGGGHSGHGGHTSWGGAYYAGGHSSGGHGSWGGGAHFSGGGGRGGGGGGRH